MANNLEIELQRIGLDEREAKVYLASLELGPSPVQKIAQRARVPRATTYLVLDDLKSKGFITTYDEGKKTFFVAQSPDQLQNLLKLKEQRLQEEKDSLKDLLPELKKITQFKTDDTSPVVRYYEGEGGLKAFFRDIWRFEGKEVLSLMDHDESTQLLSLAGGSWGDVAQKRKRHKVKRKLIVVGEKPEGLKRIHKSGPAIFITKNQLPLRADVDIIGDFVGFMPYQKPLRCVLIHDPSIARTMSTIFHTIWEKFER